MDSLKRQGNADGSRCSRGTQATQTDVSGSLVEGRTEYARRIALLRGYYFEHAPEIAPYLLSVPPAERLHMQRVPGDRWRGYRTVAGMVALITAVLAGSTAALEAILIFDHSLAGAVISGTVVALPTLSAMIRYQDSAWERAATEPLRHGED
jgi:hypothetical protein